MHGHLSEQRLVFSSAVIRNEHMLTEDVVLPLHRKAVATVGRFQ